MKYEMPVLTEARRDEVVAWLEEGVACSDEYGFSGNVLKSMQIALASLTAEPEYNTSDAEDVHLDVKKAAYDRCHPDYRWISYTAPPVPEMKPVILAKDLKVKDSAHQSHIDYMEGYNDRAEMDRNAIRAAGYEVKE